MGISSYYQVRNLNESALCSLTLVSVVRINAQLPRIYPSTGYITGTPLLELWHTPLHVVQLPLSFMQCLRQALCGIMKWART